MAAKVARPCQRNDCPAPARAGVELNHGDKIATLVDLPDERDPRRMELCADHAGKMSVPLGWTRVDERQDEDPGEPQGPPSVTELTSAGTLEALTAALEADEDDGLVGSVSEVTALPVSGLADPAGTGGPDPDDGATSAAVMAAVLAHGLHSEDAAPNDATPGDGAPADATTGDVDPADDISDVGQSVGDDEPVAASEAGPSAPAETGVHEVVTDAGTQLVLAEADRMARRARPVPAATDD
jgi:hypothetical protein